MSHILYWWLVFTILIITVGLFFYTGFYAVIFAQDVTKLTFVILALTLLASAKLGYDVYVSYKNNTELETDDYWFMADRLLTIGIMGTLIGFAYMFSQIDLKGLTGGNVAGMQALVTLMIQGLGTKLYVSLFGIIGETFLKVQLKIVEKYNAKFKKV